MIRIGQGFDAHAFADDRRLVLGGVEIPDSPGLAGHSDADVVSHAIADALLGAAALGDLGALFPPSDRWKNASSLEILAETAATVRGAGWGIANVDATVIAERPRLAAFVDGMTMSLATTLELAVTSVSVKATTTDGLGFTGRREGIAATAVVLIERS